MKILFDGRLGTCGSSRRAFWAGEPSPRRDGGRDDIRDGGRLAVCATALATASGFKVGGKVGGG